MADVRYMRGAAMRLVACLTMCLVPILANAAHAQAPSDPQGYCVNRSADFYPYTGEPCKSGCQVGLDLALFVCADAIVGNEPAPMRRHGVPPIHA